VPRFFVPASHVGDGRALIDGDDAAHLARSLRAVPGERIVVADDSGMEHGIRLVAVTPERVEGEVEWSRPATGEPRLEVHVVQAIAKDGMDELVEALAEVGAAAIWPVLTRRTVARPDARRAEHRVARWRAIARNAAGLAGRGRPPVVHDVRDLDEVPAALPASTRLLACAVDAPTALARIQPPPSAGERLAVVVGPEGGLADDDLDMLRRAGADMVHIGPRVLRARLAGAVATSLLLSAAGDMDATVAGWQAPAATAP
jgi:16S rRNA (uracil1498-N3)-methyltransferase